ncbi:EF-hand domain-containing protein [Psychromonas arctica]|uniref:EF-hand domain-containing protein n=1 Tax=Psychromonas arctica TaxID=168275 RepID=UPI002FD3552E
MKNSSNILFALVLSVGVMGQSYAAGSDQGGPQGGPPQFSSVDTNGDGELTFDEFSNQEIPHGDHQAVFDDMDSDGNGVVSENEFSNFKPPR